MLVNISNINLKYKKLYFIINDKRVNDKQIAKSVSIVISRSNCFVWNRKPLKNKIVKFFHTRYDTRNYTIISAWYRSSQKSNTLFCQKNNHIQH